MDKEKIEQIETKIDDMFRKGTEQFDTDIDLETVNTLSEALSVDYIEKWKVYARMKLAERNFAMSENLRKGLVQKLVQVNANLEVCLKSLEDKKIAVDYELKEKEKFKAQVKELQSELKSLKKAKEVSERSAPEKKSPAKNA